MTLKPCRECRKEVSTQAKTCPQCGVPHPTSQLDPGTKQALGCLALIIVGETVYLTDTGIFSGVVKVRKRGETTEYWTNMEAIP